MNQQIQLEQVEKLVDKTGATYGEAKEALEQANGDMLDALIWLEEKGIIKKTAEKAKTDNAYSYSYSTQNEQEQKKNQARENFEETTKNFGEWLKKVFDKGNSNYLEMYRDGEKKFSMPVTVFVILLIFLFWIILPLMIVSLFFNFRYSFSGKDLGKESVNNAMSKATDIADNIRTEVAEIVNNKSDEE